jgi:hypothetical protein
MHKRTLGTMKKLLLATTAALGLAVSAGAANATLTYTVWSGATVLAKFTHGTSWREAQCVYEASGYWWRAASPPKLNKGDMTMRSLFGAVSAPGNVG